MAIKNEDYDRFMVMIYSMHTMQYRGISVREIVKMTLRNIIDAYQVSEDARCLDLIEMHLQAYVNMGNGLDPEEEEIREALTLIGKRAIDWQNSDHNFMGRRITAVPLSYIQKRCRKSWLGNREYQAYREEI